MNYEKIYVALILLTQVISNVLAQNAPSDKTAALGKTSFRLGQIISKFIERRRTYSLRKKKF